MLCGNCRSSLAEGSRFCDQCGAAQSFRCTACGNENRANSRFCAQCGGSLAAPRAVPAETAPAAPLAERRQLTVMFCDLAESTALAARLDPEDLREVIAGFHRCLAAAVAPFGGYLARIVGDGALIYFGYPEAREDDAECAIRAGLATVAAVSALKLLAGSFTPRLRIGIATGLVVVGEILGRGAAPDQDVTGETPNLAARLQAVAEPDTVVVAASTRKLVGSLFDCREIGPFALKGFAEPVAAWHVLCESGVASRFAAFHAAALTPLVGRDEEIGLLLRLWRRAVEGQGQVVLLAGEPGIGKSRLAVTLQERLDGEAHASTSYFCLPHHEASALHPVIGEIERAAGVTHDDPAAIRLAKLRALLGAQTKAEDVARIAELLGLPADAPLGASALTPQRKREETLAALLRQVEAAAEKRPLLMLVEDAHWSDPTSRELLDLLMRRIEHWPVLLLITFRAEFIPPWTGQAHATMLTLGRLDRREGAALVNQLAGSALSRDLVDEIIDRTDGVPLFLEELTKSIAEGGAPRGSTSAARPVAAVPATLHASLMARLDRIGPAAKEVAQIGAAIGREFSYELLAAVADRPGAVLDGALNRLVEAGLIFRRGGPPDARFLFKHALVQDAAYGTLLRSRRQALHAAIAEALERRLPRLVEQKPELLARHLSEAAKPAAALPYWRLAIAHALASSAYREAVGHCRSGLRLVETLDAGSECVRAELHLQLQEGVALVASAGPAAPAVLATYGRALSLAEEAGDVPAEASALLGLWAHHQAQVQLRPAAALAQRLVGIGDARGDAALAVQGHAAALTVLYMMGDFAEAWRHFERGTALYEPKMHVVEAVQNYVNPGPDMLLHGAFVAWVTGHADRARQLAEEGLAASRRREPYTHAHCVYLTGHLAELQDDWPAVRRANDETIALARRWGFAGTLRQVAHRATRVAAAEGDAEPLRREEHERRQPGFARPLHEVVLARLCGSLGLAEDGLRRIERALAFSRQTACAFFDAELQREAARLNAQLRRWDEAEGGFVAAVATARGQGAAMWELRAATDLAQLWADRGERDRAADLLAPVCESMGEGIAIPELRRARALLQALGRAGVA